MVAARPSAAVKPLQRIIFIPPLMIARAPLDHAGPARATSPASNSCASNSGAGLTAPAAREDHPGGEERDAAAKRSVVDALVEQRPVPAFGQERHVEEH